MTTSPRHRADARSTRRLSVTLALVAAVVVSGCSGAGTAAEITAAAEPSPAASVTTNLAPSQTPVTSPSPVALDIPIRSSAPEAQAAPQVDEPQRLSVPSLSIEMPVTSVGVEPDGAMEIPDDADVAGWYEYGPAPAEQNGNAVMAAHVDSLEGLGPFSRLLDVELGAQIDVESASGDTLIYEVVEVEQTDKREVDLSGVFVPEGPGQLVLVTCGGQWDGDRGHYNDNVIVTAVLADGIS
ncbi:class F sortase [Demequina sediminicola]|uniref:class F sortase n=1 Tax=Demequina sediminicola TaxID=1095026 RepID=UPI0007827E00|nr:class F sortase [Demequina sediminicola]